MNLLPEKSQDIQISTSIKWSENSSYKIEIFKTEISDLIEYDLNASKMRNIGKASMNGIQLGYMFTGEKFDIRLNAINQKAKNDVTKQDLLRRPNQSITLNITRGFNDALFGLSILASGQRKDFGVTLPGLSLIHI